ncbi:MAG: hypothetical protein G01um101433_1054, partial [Parcubacteria group bacterium Gr01-1014_33]
EAMPIVFRDTVHYSPYLYDIFESYHTLEGRRQNIALGETEILPGVKVFAKGAGHLPGALSFIFDLGNGEKGLITGDQGMHYQYIVDGAKYCSEDVPKEYMPTHVLGMDLTHGMGRRMDFVNECDRLVEASVKILDNKGIALVGAFGFGRGQNVAIAYARKGIEVYVDGVIRKVFELYAKHIPLSSLMDKIKFIRSPEERDELLESGEPAVIITTGGMADAGPILGYLPRVLPRPKGKAAVFFTSWTAPDSNATKIVNKSKRKNTKILLENENGRRVEVPINCTVDHFHPSAHWDPYEMEGYFEDIVKVQGKLFKTMCPTHGTWEAKCDASLRLGDLADNTIFGEPGVSFEI